MLKRLLKLVKGPELRKWGLYLCSCGSTFTARCSAVNEGNTTSCGCVARRKSQQTIKLAHKANTKHGEAVREKRTYEYDCWQNIKRRCLYKKHPSYKDYGGRGITLYEPWINSFTKFREYIGKRPRRGLEIDRINNNGGYCPGNLRWATRKQQCNNTRRQYV